MLVFVFGIPNSSSLPKRSRNPKKPKNRLPMADRETVVDMLTHLGQEQALMKSFGSFATDDDKHLDRFKELITAYNQLRAKYEQRGGEAVVGLIASVDASIKQCRALIRELEAQPAKEMAMDTRMASLLVRVKPVCSPTSI